MKAKIKKSTVNILMMSTLVAAVLAMFGFFYGARVDGWHSDAVIVAYWAACVVTMSLLGAWLYAENVYRPT